MNTALIDFSHVIHQVPPTMHKHRRSLLAVVSSVAFLATVPIASAEPLIIDGGTPQSYDGDFSYSTVGSVAVSLSNGANLTINGNIDADASYKGQSANDTGAGIKAESGSQASFNGNVTVTANGPYMNGLWANGTDSKITVSGQQLEITVNSDRTEAGQYGPQTSGIYALGGTRLTQPAENSASVIINAENTIINVNIENNDGGDYPVAAITATSNGIVKINGNLKASARYLISTRGDSLVAINENNENRTVQLEGTIQYASPTDGTTPSLDSSLVINLKGDNSYWTGTIMSYDTDSDALNLGIADGAQWNVAADLPDPNAHYVKADSVTLDAGVINAEKAGQEVLIENLTITEHGGTFNSVAEKDEAGKIVTSVLSIDQIEGNASQTNVLNVNYEGITSDDLTEDNIGDLKGLSIQNGGDTVAVTEVVSEGDIRGAWTRGPGDDATGSFAENTKLSSYSSITAMSLVQWRNEINHLTKRLGDIRASESTIGAWARVYGGASEWGSNPEVDMDHTTIQVGGDYRINPNWIVGGAFSYTDSDAESGNGFADGESYSLAAYATYLADNGSFLDVIARYGYLKNDITAGNMALETKNNAFSLSVEGGHQFRFIEDRAYIEPQIELTYGFVSGDDADASNGVRIEQDDYQNLITRVGVRTGFDFPEKAGTIYATLSYSYDFLGDADGTASGQTEAGYESVALTEDLGGGWVTYGIGAQFRLGDNAFAYGELERTSGGDIDNPYLFNVGFRYNF